MGNTSDDIPTLERPSFFNGQRLMADDLSEVQKFHQELRWLHNRSLHSWGIAFGYQVLGNRGDRKVQISSGYAIDCEGRDLILTEPIEKTIPAVAGDSEGKPILYYLTASYAVDNRIPAETQVGTCGSSGAVSRPEQPIIRWQNPNDTDADSRYRQGEDVVLAAIRVKNCQLSEAISPGERRNAVPDQQPYLSAGQTISQKTEWRLFPPDNPIGIATTVSTISAGFRVTPRYQAHIVGERQFEGDVKVHDRPELQKRKFVVDGYVQITQMTASSFEVQVILQPGNRLAIWPTYEVTSNDIDRVIRRFAERASGNNPDVFTFIVQTLRGRVSVGQTVGVATVQLEDFNPILAAITSDHNISVGDLLAANGFSQTQMSLAQGDRLIIPKADSTLMLNPSDVIFEPEFMSKFKVDLGWSVVWMGVEG